MHLTKFTTLFTLAFFISKAAVAQTGPGIPFEWNKPSDDELHILKHDAHKTLSFVFCEESKDCVHVGRKAKYNIQDVETIITIVSVDKALADYQSASANKWLIGGGAGVAASFSAGYFPKFKSGKLGVATAVAQLISASAGLLGLVSKAEAIGDAKLPSYVHSAILELEQGNHAIVKGSKASRMASSLKVTLAKLPGA